MLEIKKASKTWRGQAGPVKALSEAELRAEPGEFVVVRGPSGSGKTTLLLLAGGLLAPDEGEILWDGKNPYALPPGERAALRARTVGFVFQQFHLVPYLTVEENVLAPTLAAPLPDGRKRAALLLDRFGLAGRARHRPGELSTGEKQRAALARALLLEPPLLLADEPTGNLDQESSRGILEAFEDYTRSGGTILLVTHDPALAPRKGREFLLREGRLREVSSREKEPGLSSREDPRTPR
ncbi:MAG TPA: ATP-binding cassette domain-containing protein [Planctomycetes bacterium]|nr:ATP-binding cassette domain-containing protein [Planctomycetota bacterium]